MVESLKRQNIALFLKIFGKRKEKQKGLLSKGIDLIRMMVVNKITKMRVCSMDIKTKFGGKFSLLTSVEKKGMKDRDKDAKSEGWNLGNF